MSTPESKTKKFVRDELHARGAWFFMPPANGFGKGGIPDYIGCLKVKITPEMVGNEVGVFFGIECKADGKLNTLTELQKMRLQEIAEAGGCAAAVDNIAFLREVLDALERGGG